MTWISGIAVFFLVWWTVLFAVLPWGVRSEEESPAQERTPGTMPGAPVRPRLALKMAITTVLAVVIWLVIFGIVESGIISFRDMAKDM